MDGKIEIEEASRILKRRPRSVYRMVRKVREKGPEGVFHGNRNKVSRRRVPAHKLLKRLLCSTGFFS
jgi:hypothetical protein